MTNFQTILSALRVAKSGAQMRVAMGMSLGDNAYGDCRAEQLARLIVPFIKFNHALQALQFAGFFCVLRTRRNRAHTHTRP